MLSLSSPTFFANKLKVFCYPNLASSNEETVVIIIADRPDIRGCNEPVNFCTGHTIGESNHEYDDGRRYQEMDGQAQSGVGDGNHSRQDHHSEARALYIVSSEIEELSNEVMVLTL